MIKLICPDCNKDFTDSSKKLGTDAWLFHRLICPRDAEIRRLREQLATINKEAQKLNNLLENNNAR